MLQAPLVDKEGQTLQEVWFDRDFPWYEIHVEDSDALADLYAHAYSSGCVGVHHFNFEPWHPGGPVMRVQGCKRALNDFAAYVREHDLGQPFTWDPRPDEELFGDRWETVSNFFEAASKMFIAREDREDWTLDKEVHCFLNAQGLDVDDEIRWAVGFAYRRVRMWLADKRHAIRVPLRKAVR